MGPLYCLTSGDGQVAWVRLSDVRAHFGVSLLTIWKEKKQKKKKQQKNIAQKHV